MASSMCQPYVLVQSIPMRCPLLPGHEGEHLLETVMLSVETVNHPPHYGGDTTYEAIKVIEAWQLNFNLGNTVKYIARADHKGQRTQDLQKARWYLDRELARLKATGER